MATSSNWPPSLQLGQSLPFPAGTHDLPRPPPPRPRPGGRDRRAGRGDHRGARRHQARRQPRQLHQHSGQGHVRRAGRRWRKLPHGH